MLNEIFKKDSLKYNHKYNELLKYLSDHQDKKMHLIILLSDGGVSSHIDHLRSFIDELNKSKVTNDILIHVISDGRDSDKYSVNKYIKEIENITGPKVKIASVCGRYYALDENVMKKNYLMNTYHQLRHQT